MTDSLFDQNDNNTEIQFDENKDYFGELVGEGKKFRDPQTLAKAKAQSDHYIKTLERRQDEMRQELIRKTEEANAQAKLQELIDRLEKPQKDDTTSSDNPNANADNTNQPSFDPNKIQSLVSESIVQYENTKKQRENMNVVQEKLKEQLGPNFQSVLQEKINSLGLSIDDVNNLAKKSPNAFFNTLGLTQTSPQDNGFMAPPRSNQRGTAFAPTGRTKRNESYYAELKKSDPKAYFDHKTTIQMEKDALELGEAFFDRTFANG